MTLIERIATITQLWEMLVPGVPKPQPIWVGRWCAYPDAAVEKGIIRASKKFAPYHGNVTNPELVYQYVCGVARNEAMNIQRHEQASA